MAGLVINHNNNLKRVSLMDHCFINQFQLKCNATEELDSALSATAPPLGTDALDEFFNFSSDSPPEPTTATGLSDDDDQEGPACATSNIHM